MPRRYGPIGQPIQGLPPPGTGARPGGGAQRKPSRAAGRAGAKAGGPPAGGGKADISQFQGEFAEMIDYETPQGQLAPRDTAVVDAKAANATNGLETSTFTVCTRIRPPLGDENRPDAGNLVCVVPGERRGHGNEHCEQATVLTPTVSLQGEVRTHAIRAATT